MGNLKIFSKLHFVYLRNEIAPANKFFYSEEQNHNKFFFSIKYFNENIDISN